MCFIIELGLDNKLIDIESPPVTPSKPPPAPQQTPADNTQNTSNKTSGRSSAHSKRKRTRHKIYLDDPDVHQLINNHVLLLHKYADDLKSGKYQRRETSQHNSKS